MSHPIKIVLIGAGSREFSKGLIHDLILEKELIEARKVSVTLVDIDPTSLGPMLDYARRKASEARAPITFDASTDRQEALPGADFVLISIATKRMELWEQDFRIPLAYGVKHVYGENGGPGAAFHALRNFQTILPICHDIEALCPEAWVLNFTNPEARMLTAILTLTKVKAIGLCHGFYSFRRLASAVLDRPLQGLDVRTAGMNHFYTYYKLVDKASGLDLIPEFERRLAENLQILPPLVAYFWKTFGALGYTSDHHMGEYLGFAHEFMGTKWLFGIENRRVAPEESGVDGRLVFEAWRRGLEVNDMMKRDVLGQEKTSFVHGSGEPIESSGELAVPVIADIILDRKQWRASVNVLNSGGFIENLDQDTAVELPATVDASGVHPEQVGRLPEGFASLVRQQQAVQRLLVQAYQKKSKKLLLQALLLDPAVAGQAQQIGPMLDHMLQVQAPYLPQFS